jgi:phage shock protein E
MNNFLIDVRTPGEFASGHREGAINIPVNQIMSGNLGALASAPKDTVIECYCRTGSRAEYAMHVLKQLGYTKAVNGGGLR